MMAMNITWSYRDRADRLAARLTQIARGGTRQPADAQIRKLQIASTSRTHAPALRVLAAGAAKSRLADHRRHCQSSACISHVPLLVGNRLLHDARRPTTQETPMLMSTDRILVSHVGSLPRPPTLSELLIRQDAGETIDAAELARQVEIATTHVIDKQVEAGVDVGNDGEQSRVGFQTYVSRCLCGFGGESRRPPSRDQIDFPSYARQTELRFPHSAPASASGSMAAGATMTGCMSMTSR
jgi:hypothetical protein